jgi:uncharacterized lipoprotein YbaY
MADNVPAGWAALSGSVTYRQRIALPPNAMLTVEVADVSRADAPATVLAASMTLTGGRQVPLPFTLIYNPELIEDRYTYAISARIMVDGQLAWRSTTQQPVLSRGAPADNVTVVVEQIPRPV